MLKNWLERHRHPASLGLHVIGIPAAVGGVVVLVAAWFQPIAHAAWWFVGLFVGGYALQFLGHAIEGNDAGEVILFKKLLGKPYVAVVTRKDESESAQPQAARRK